MRNLFFLAFFAFFCTINTVYAQNTEMFRRSLQTPDSVLHTTVSVYEHGDAATAVRDMQGRDGDTKIDGYRVRIFSDNSQNARSGAMDAEKRFTEMYPDTPAYMVYENPYFKVTVGNCRTLEEAIILEEKIRGTFPQAYRVPEKIPITLFGE